MTNQPLSSNTFFESLGRHKESQLVFLTGDTKVNPGYHVTEVKKARISSLDCGRGTDEWDELVIQLLDGSPASKAGYMPVGKFLGIAATAADTTADRALYFEFSPGNGPLLKLSANQVTHSDNKTIVHLDSLSAQCKPLSRYMASGGKGCCRR
jgi:hypothetical protein